MEEIQEVEIPEILINARNVEQEGVSDALIDYIVTTNDKDYNLTKTAEELSELATVLLQYVNKKGSKKQPTLTEINEEIGDVMFRLYNLFNPKVGLYRDEEQAEQMLSDRMNFKLSKYLNFVQERKYIGKI